jgi:DNA mismatch repair protein MutL
MPPASPRRVAILPDAVANQIAAGEVVERPASVVKELIENALDAGARHIRVELEQGGKTLIAVSDDGSGMSREDAVLALDRHATSKLASAADLVGVATFGFRGEALPAIASVARFSMVTSDGTEGTAVTVTGGRVDEVAATARQQGTTVTVRGIFFNTPARRKFLRSVPSETRAATDAIAVLALAHPEAGFELVLDGEIRLHAPAGQRLAERIGIVWGPALAATLVPVEYAMGSVRVSGFVQRPADAMPTGRRAQLFVHGRPFRDTFLVRAAESGYRSAIHPGDRPSMLLDIAVPVEDVDVNVHPAKLEVRFRDHIAVERVLEEAVRHALGAMAAAAPVGIWRPELGPGSGVGSAPPSLFAPVGSDAGEQETASAPNGGSHAGGRFAAPVLQIFDSYLAFEGPEGLVVVDQHSAHERVLYEEIMAQIAQGGAASQRLLLPETLELTDEEIAVVEANRDTLDRVGFQVDPGAPARCGQSSPWISPRRDLGL